MSKVFIAGHNGMVGKALVRALAAPGEHQLITRTREELDLTNQAAVKAFFEAEQIDQVYLAAAKVGGIYANHTYPADFIYQNLMIEANVIHQAFACGIKKLLFLGSSCIYPRQAPQPIDEDALMSGSLEPTNEPYAVAKIAGIKMCESYNRQYGMSHGVDYRSVMPTNLFGPGDNYHPENSHVVPALIRRFCEATETGADRVTIWGSGQPRREFLHVDDMAVASIFVMNLNKEEYHAATKPMQRHINVGSGSDITIAELATMIAEAAGFSGEIVFDLSKPDGAPRKLMNSEKLHKMGWAPRIALLDGLRTTVESYKMRNHFEFLTL
jgi:GDP-L-fucose synthase